MAKRGFAPVSVSRGPESDRAALPRLVQPGTEPGPTDDTISRLLVEPLTRRQFVARAVALGVSASALGTVLQACAQAARPSVTPSATPSPSPVITPEPTFGGTPPVITPEPTFGGTPPVIDPTPTTATYGAMLETSALAPVSVPSAALRALLDEVAADARIPVAPLFVDGRRQARLTVTADDPWFASQAYRLEVAPTADGPAVAVRAGDEAGAFYGLLSLARLVVTEASTRWLRAATVDDAPGFARRGDIVDAGATDASHALALERLRLGVRHKLNFVSVVPTPEILRFCDDHHVELMVGVAYHDRPTPTPAQALKDEIAAKLDAGIRSITLLADEVQTTDPEALGHVHAAIFTELYDFIRSRSSGIRVSALLPVYGGIPGQALVNSPKGHGERYLAVIHDDLPAEMPTFWTGDGGVFSPTVTAAGARAFADAAGREIMFWDNSTITFSRQRQPCSGRAADLDTVAHTYVGNLGGEADWSGTNGEFALLTTLFYSWNPATYDPAGAASAAERILARGL